MQLQCKWTFCDKSIVSQIIDSARPELSLYFRVGQQESEN